MPRAQGLFQEVMGGDLKALYLDVLEHPEKYDRETIDLVTDLMSTGRQILAADRQKLDLAVYDFTKPLEQKPPPPPKIKQRVAPPAFSEPVSRPAPVAPPTADLGRPNEDVPQAFWWLRDK